MANKQISLLITGVFLIICGTGCAGKTIKPDSRRTGVVLINLAEGEGQTQLHEKQDKTELGPGSNGMQSAIPISEEQLRSAKMGLEAFRLFCGQFKIQADRTTLNSIKKPAMDYIRKQIDPILNRRHQLKDDDYSRDIITIYYLKAYLHWIFDDAGPAREMVAQIKEHLPEKLKKRMIHHFDQGEVTIEGALHELEVRMASRSEVSKGLETD